METQPRCKWVAGHTADGREVAVRFDQASLAHLAIIGDAPAVGRAARRLVADQLEAPPLGGIVVLSTDTDTWPEGVHVHDPNVVLPAGGCLPDTTNVTPRLIIVEYDQLTQPSRDAVWQLVRTGRARGIQVVILADQDTSAGGSLMLWQTGQQLRLRADGTGTYHSRSGGAVRFCAT